MLFRKHRRDKRILGGETKTFRGQNAMTPWVEMKWKKRFPTRTIEDKHTVVRESEGEGRGGEERRGGGEERRGKEKR